MGPPQGSQVSRSRQGAGWRSQPRLCLLKGCERPFLPCCPQQRYCDTECQKKAAAWRSMKARRAWRTSRKGQQKRCAQARRRRERQKALKLSSEPLAEAGVGHRLAGNLEGFLCDRPGCFERFKRRDRSPLQRFCSSACRNALRRVWRREERHRQRVEKRGSPHCGTGCAGGSHIDRSQRRH